MQEKTHQNLAKIVIIFLGFFIPSFIFFGLSNEPIYSASSDTINLQGKIVRNDVGHEGLNISTGSPACVVSGDGNDTCDFRVRYYDAPTAGNLLLTEQFSNVEIGQYVGVFNVSLGSDPAPSPGVYTSLSSLIQGESDVYVEVGFDPSGLSTYTEVFSRMPLEATGYAIRAKYADTASGASEVAWSGLKNPTADVSLQHSTYTTLFNWATGTGTNNLFSLTSDASSNGTGALMNIQTGTGSSLIPLRVRAGNTDAIYVDSAGNVGIGTTSPFAKLHIKGSADDKQFIIQANTTQTSPLIVAQDSSGIELFRIDSDNSYNFFAGYQAGLNNNPTGIGGVEGLYNIAIGYQSLLENTSGSSNVGIGTGALKTNTTGLNNVAIGNASLRDGSGGSYNVALGGHSLLLNQGSYNVALGTFSLDANTTGQRNVGLGYGSLTANTTGSRNVAIGMLTLASSVEISDLVAIGNEALRYNTTGTGNLAIGSYALDANTTGYDNTAVGFYSLSANVSGYGNMALGSYSLFNNIGNNNTAIGNAASVLNTTGGNNVSIGRSALYSNSTGSGNIAIGYQAGYNETGSNKLYIANSDTSTPLIYGLFSGTGAGLTIHSQATNGVPLTVKGIASQASNLQEWQNSTGTVLTVVDENGNLGIGTTSPTSLLSVGSTSQFQVNTLGDIVKLKSLTYSWPSSHTIDGFLKNDGTGNLTWTMGVSGSGTAGQATFWTGTSTVSGDNAFWWDNINKRLGIGTVSPQEKLTLASASNFATEMATPGVPTLTCNTTGGTLADGTYYYKIVATDGVGTTVAGTQGSCTITGGSGAGSVSISWSEVTGASSYRIYGRDTNFGQYWTSSTTSYTDTGTAGTTGTPPTVTTAYVNKLTASGNSWLLGGSVGVGTASASYKFHVSGSSTSLVNLGDTVYVDSTNNRVGIGVVDPSSKLTVYGSSTATTIGGFEVGMRIANTDTTTNNWQSIVFGDTAKAAIEVKNVDHTNDYGDIAFTTRASDGWLPRMYIQSGGDVGIGTDNPLAKLHVKGNQILLKNEADVDTGLVLDSGSTTTYRDAIYFKDRGTDVFALEKTATNAFQLYEYTGTGVSRIFVEGGTNGGINFRTKGTGDFSFINDTTTKVIIKSGGNVGIGTTDPGAKLDVLGTFKVSSSSSSSAYTTQTSDTDFNAGTFDDTFVDGTGVVADVKLKWDTSSVSAGYDNSLAIKTDGTLWAWGANSYGQLGLGDTTDRTSPVQVGTGTNWSQVSAGGFHTMAIKTDGTLWVWGYNYHGQLGLGDTTNRTSPVQVGTGTNWSQITAGVSHTLGIKTDGTLWAWGRNSYGQLGLGDTTDRTSPVQVGTGTDWSQVVAGDSHTLAIKTDGTLWAWGYNYHGQLGLGDTTDRTSPVQVGTGTDWSQVSAGGLHTMAVKTDGTLWVWGYNYYSQLGLGDTTNRTSPVQVGTGTDWSKVAAGTHHTLAIKTDGTLWAWGDNYYGQLGLNDTTDRTIPTLVGIVVTWSQVATGGSHTLAIKTDGTLWAWGSNSYGQLGLGDTTDRTSPVQVGTGTNWSQVAAGGYHTIAIKTDGTLWAWGYNSSGQLGLGDTTNRTSPVQVGTGTDWSKVAAGTYHTLAIKTSGTLWTWGGNYCGQLGLADTTDRTSPVQVGAGTDWSQITAGKFHTLAIKTSGTLWAWGANYYGQLGLGDTTDRTSPVQVGTGTDWDRVTAGWNHTLAIKTGGTLWAWGYNSSGQLGLGDTTDRTSPVQVGTGTDWSQVSVGGGYTIAIKTDGTLWAWGYNGYGQLGLNNTTDCLVPFSVMIYSTSGTFISSAIDASELSQIFTTLTFTINKPAGTNLKFQLRSATTQAGLSSATWYGPTGTGDYYESSGTTINSVHENHRWIQYKAYFSTTNIFTVPTLSDITINYGYYSDFYITSSGDVGIGTMSPGTKLDVKGDITAYGDIYLGHDGGGDSDINFYDDNSDTWRTLSWSDSNNSLYMENDDGSSYKVWNSGNDGTDSGLDADMVDGMHASAFFAKPTEVKETTATHNGNFGGYAALHTWIQSNGCSGGHVCTPDELAYAFTTLPSTKLCGDGICNGKYSSVVRSLTWSGDKGDWSYTSDCLGWTNGLVSNSCPRIYNNQPSYADCNDNTAFLCCF